MKFVSVPYNDLIYEIFIYENEGLLQCVALFRASALHSEIVVVKRVRQSSTESCGFSPGRSRGHNIVPMKS